MKGTFTNVFKVYFLIPHHVLQVLITASSPWGKRRKPFCLLLKRSKPQKKFFFSFFFAISAFWYVVLRVCSPGNILCIFVQKELLMCFVTHHHVLQVLMHASSSSFLGIIQWRARAKQTKILIPLMTPILP